MYFINFYKINQILQVQSIVGTIYQNSYIKFESMHWHSKSLVSSLEPIHSAFSFEVQCHRHKFKLKQVWESLEKRNNAYQQAITNKDHFA